MWLPTLSCSSHFIKDIFKYVCFLDGILFPYLGSIYKYSPKFWVTQLVYLSSDFNPPIVCFVEGVSFAAHALGLREGPAALLATHVVGRSAPHSSGPCGRSARPAAPPQCLHSLRASLLCPFVIPAGVAFDRMSEPQTNTLDLPLSGGQSLTVP